MVVGVTIGVFVLSKGGALKLLIKVKDKIPERNYLKTRKNRINN